MREHNAGPWRFNAADYVAAVQVASGLAQRLEGVTAEASWDVGLAAVMHEHGVAVAVAEEAVAARLLSDLTDR